jgi:hypothetical protein
LQANLDLIYSRRSVNSLPGEREALVASTTPDYDCNESTNKDIETGFNKSTTTMSLPQKHVRDSCELYEENCLEIFKPLSMPRWSGLIMPASRMIMP